MGLLRIHGVSESRARAIEDILRHRAWSSAVDIGIVLDGSGAVRSALGRMCAAGQLIRRIEVGDCSRKVAVYALPGTPDEASSREETIKAEPVRRADGVLVCPTAYAFGYVSSCRHIRPSGRKGARRS